MNDDNRTDKLEAGLQKTYQQTKAPEPSSDFSTSLMRDVRNLAARETTDLTESMMGVFIWRTASLAAFAALILLICSSQAWSGLPYPGAELISLDPMEYLLNAPLAI